MKQVVLKTVCQIDSDSEDDGSGSDIQSGPRKRRKQAASKQGTSCLDPEKGFSPSKL